MEKDFKRIGTVKNMSETKLKIKNLYKIFGPNAGKYVNPVKEGMSKQALLDEHNHVLGLNNIN